MQNGPIPRTYLVQIERSSGTVLVRTPWLSILATHGEKIQRLIGRNTSSVCVGPFQRTWDSLNSGLACLGWLTRRKLFIQMECLWMEELHTWLWLPSFPLMLAFMQHVSMNKTRPFPNCGSLMQCYTLLFGDIEWCIYRRPTFCILAARNQAAMDDAWRNLGQDGKTAFSRLVPSCCCRKMPLILPRAAAAGAAEEWT